MHLDRYSRLRTVMLVAVAVLAATTGIIIEQTDALRSVELASVDSRFRIRGDAPEPRSVAVVEIDQASLDELGLRWPLPRSLHARAIDRLVGEGARTIAYDVVFLQASQPREDAALRRAITRAGNVVLATSEANEDGATTILGMDRAALASLGATLGSSLVPPDPGGPIRRVAPRVAGFDAFGIAVADSYLGHRVARPSGNAWLDYAGPAGTIRTARFADLVAGRTPQGFFRDRAVVVGPSASAVGDLHPTSVAQDEYMAGAEIHASAIRTALAGFPLDEPPGLVGMLLIVGAGAVPAGAALIRRPLVGVLVVVLAAAALLAGAQLAFAAGHIVPVVAPAAALVLATVGALATRAVTGAMQRQHVRDVFARFVPGPVVDAALAQTGADLRLGGTELDATVLFSDLRGFTGFTETLPPDRVIAVLNGYLESMSEAILGHGGTLVAYMGDGIMAVFGAPLAQTDHADRAFAAASEMAGERLDRFNAWLAADGVDHSFRMGVGLNSGPVMSGNVGSPDRLEYTAVGDTTNTAARLEGMTKGTPHQLFVADSTRERLSVTDGLVLVGELPVRGREGAVRVWAPI